MSQSQQSEVNSSPQQTGLHRRTWELELLISGAIVVALFQLPEAVDAVFDGLKSRVSRELFKVVWTVYFPAKLAITPALIVFSIHILLRGFWVGMVGLNAVFKDGIDWDKVTMPPILRAYHKPRTNPQDFEKKLDRAASLLFAVLFSLLSQTAALGFWLTTGMILVVAIASSPFGSNHVLEIWNLVYFGIIFFVAAPGLLAILIDKCIERWPSLARRLPFLVSLCRLMLIVGSAVMLVRLWYPAALTMTSNLTKKKPETWRVIMVTVPATFVLMAVVFAGMIGGPLYRSFDSYIFTPPRPQESGVSSRYYESMRDPGEAVNVPTVQADVISDPYLRLYLPYDAWRDNDRLAELCPDAKPFRKDGDLLTAFRRRPTEASARIAVLGCFEKFWTVELNEKPVELDLAFSDEPGGRGVGVVAYVSTADLPSGKNRIVVTRFTSKEEEKRSRFNREEHVFHIPFWR